MTAKELSEMLSGRKYGMEITSVEFDRAADAGLVVVYGYSDDNIELAGAIDDEVGAYEGTTIYITHAGVLHKLDCDQDSCPYFAKEREKAKTIKARHGAGEVAESSIFESTGSRKRIGLTS